MKETLTIKEMKIIKLRKKLETAIDKMKEFQNEIMPGYHARIESKSYNLAVEKVDSLIGLIEKVEEANY